MFRLFYIFLAVAVISCGIPKQERSTSSRTSEEERASRKAQMNGENQGDMNQIDNAKIIGVEKPALKNGVSYKSIALRFPTNAKNLVRIKMYDGNYVALAADPAENTTCEKGEDCSLKISAVDGVKLLGMQLLPTRFALGFEIPHSPDPSVIGSGYDFSKVDDAILVFDCDDCKSFSLEDVEVFNDDSCINAFDVWTGGAQSCVAKSSTP